MLGGSISTLWDMLAEVQSVPRLFAWIVGQSGAKMPKATEHLYNAACEVLILHGL